jgi:hypothetical protein
VSHSSSRGHFLAPSVAQKLDIAAYSSEATNMWWGVGLALQIHSLALQDGDWSTRHIPQGPNWCPIPAPGAILAHVAQN